MRRVVSGIGRTLIVAGILLLIFVGYQLWGTGIYTGRAQDRLEREFSTTIATAVPQSLPPATAGPPTGSTTPTTVAAPAPPSGDAVAHLVIPRIDLDTYVVQGVDAGELRLGPGHYPDTPLPGQQGNSGIAGHRTTYLHPFGALDDLETGDQIQVTTVQGAFTYTVYEKYVVTPDRSDVLLPDPNRPAILTLTTCHPRFSAAQRLIVKAELDIPEGQIPLPAVTAPSPGRQPRSIDGDLGGSEQSRLPVVLAGLLAALVGGLWWLWFHRQPRWWVWVIGAVPFLGAFLVFCYFLERVLPNNI